MLEVMRHFVSVVKCDLVVLLQPTSPLRTEAHVREAIETLELTGASSVVSVRELPDGYSPDWVFQRGLKGELERYGGGEMDALPTSRQRCRPSLVRDGTVYVFRTPLILSGRPYGSNCMPVVIPEGESINIDTESDWSELESRG
jgi:CMP-N-acetylneuraminic acid synthetase